MSLDLLRATLDRATESGRQVTFWLRDDDAIEPTVQLETLLNMAQRTGVPLTLAVVPADATNAIAARLEEAPLVNVAVHGWRHRNHAPSGEKKQELGLHRPKAEILGELEAALKRVQSMFGSRTVAMLVPPWNRIDPALVPSLPSLGFQALSVFGEEKRFTPVPLLNTHVDIIDWKVTRGGRPADTLFVEIARRVEEISSDPLETVGILTHHLVHDAAAWSFLGTLFEHTADHPGCRWMRSEDVLRATPKHPSPRLPSYK
ncbi:polysaccharide deacetylase family protein [Rhizobium sp. LC145]|uniref:polysaccharide deacetylase family protein n=1 Tax=Rhizobium sp. LC145 TaxID=1120688 RepID=UPI000629FAA5|nr:polysaccharide deacetylase family protein [Rhizobium sp. LC145]KKX25751.1 polysaccharide deacetylase [Rhizobium sp. LC145]TKT58043.1 polysaccharide deacetylase [Rhizobiaceae bacterium LC148]